MGQQMGSLMTDGNTNGLQSGHGAGDDVRVRAHATFERPTRTIVCARCDMTIPAGTLLSHDKSSHPTTQDAPSSRRPWCTRRVCQDMEFGHPSHRAGECNNG
jgi:hypothetical protein